MFVLKWNYMFTQWKIHVHHKTCLHNYKYMLFYIILGFTKKYTLEENSELNKMGCVGQTVGHSTADREVPGPNSTLA